MNSEILVLNNQLAILRALRYLMGVHVDAKHEIATHLDKQIGETVADIKSHSFSLELMVASARMDGDDDPA